MRPLTKHLKSNERRVDVDTPQQVREPVDDELSEQSPSESRHSVALGRITDAIDAIARTIAALAIIVLMLQIMVNVAARTIFNHPLPGSLEITQYWYLPIAALLGIVSAQVRNENLRADILFGRMPAAARYWIAVVTNVLCTVVAAGFAYFSLQTALDNMSIGKTAGISGFIMWPATFVVPVAFALLAIVYLVQIFLPGLADVDYLEEDLAAAEIVAAGKASDDTATVGVIHDRAEAAASTLAAKVNATLGSRSLSQWILALVLVGVTIVSAVLMFVLEDKLTIGIIGIITMLGLLFLRVPVAVALVVPSILGMWAIRGIRPVQGLLADVAYSTTASWSLTVIPMFVFMGLLIWRSGVTGDLYAAARNWLKWLPGGLAVGTNIAGAGLGAVSGSTIGTTYALARIGIPEMLKAGYSPRMAISSVMTAGLPGQLIPPSIMLVIYAGIAETPIGQQLIAGVGPGLLVAILFSLFFIVLAVARPNLAGRSKATAAQGGDEPTVSTNELWTSLAKTWPVVLLILLVVVGMFGGVLTATEVGAAAALFAVLIALGKLRKSRPLGNIATAAVDTVRSTGSIFFLIIGGTALTRMLTLSGLSSALADGIVSLNLNAVSFLLIMVVVYLIMGMFLDPLAMMLLTVPILLPTLQAMEISPLWFGVFIVFMGELAIITPPVGMLSYIIYSITQDPRVNQGHQIKLKDVFMAVVWILPFAGLFLLIMIFVPELATVLPELVQQ